jgi:NAD/NADP transhydrogenase alpha subunit
LAILENKTYKSKSSSWYKKEFENKYINKKKRGNQSEYSKTFSKKKIEIARKNIKEVDQLILVIENKNE